MKKDLEKNNFFMSQCRSLKYSKRPFHYKPVRTQKQLQEYKNHEAREGSSQAKYKWEIVFDKSKRFTIYKKSLKKIIA